MQWIVSQLRALAERHPLLAFVGLTFALSWSLWGMQSLLAGSDSISSRWLGTTDDGSTKRRPVVGCSRSITAVP